MSINKQELINEVERVLRMSMSSDYSMHLATDDEFINDVKEDIELTSGWEENGQYNEDDIRLAVGRTLLDKYQIER